MAEIHISLAAEKIFQLGSGFPVTNSMLTSWIAIGLLALFALAVSSNIKKIPGTLQSVAEILVEGLESLFASILHEHASKFFPFLATIFLFIISMNWLGLLPGVGTIGFFHEALAHGKEEFVPLFRAGTADLNTTLALAIITVIVIQTAGFTHLGLDYAKKFINFSNPVNFFVGVLELILEFAKILSFSFRLFGNVFAGEVLLAVIAFLMPVIAPIPFLGMELFVGFIQALVFSMLTAVFLSLAVSKAGH